MSSDLQPSVGLCRGPISRLSGFSSVVVSAIVSIRAMRRGAHILAVCLFVLGMIVIPAAHKMALGWDHCHGCCSHGCGHEQPEPAKHDADRCPICQLALASLDVVTPVIVPVVSELVAETLWVPVIVPVARMVHLLPFSCGPPS